MLKPILKRISIDKNKMFINSNSNNNYINSYYSDYNSNNNLEYYNSKEKDSNLEETVVKPTVVKKFSICLVDDDNKSIQSINKIKPRVRFSFNEDTKPKQNHNRSTSHYPIKLNNDNDDDNKLSQNVRNRKTSSTEMNSVTTVTSDDSSYYEYFGGRIKKPSINQKTNYFEYQDNDYSSSLSSSSFDSNNKKMYY
ncbi:hypothetical protein LY90DRAFT_513026 [Neocallimastix californiae]|uniref:Uncharacterized protein n=1 Tax=Neocallimastix californiae TaxID=1754190 RepID=A0A1Y2B208_9FUNG|nr:hypothetical protein LY90DRAFT_513026 [Neocallimastix californiae]|eukprot:ORY28878.1 hypothetical protein LY90DRAFT_513026 [Neocallimastix californiae]